jgi:PIN domain nuclease of toxin-antitoxin system
LIILDTHIWVWWESDSSRLTKPYREILNNPDEQFAVSIISCWEVAKLVQYGRLDLDRSVNAWIESALSRPGLELIPLTPSIVVESTQLPEPCHRDPADQLIMATARVSGIRLLTADSKILAYPNVPLVVR